MFISPKRKNTIMEMALKSFILSKLDHQMSKSGKRIAGHVFETGKGNAAGTLLVLDKNEIEL